MSAEGESGFDRCAARYDELRPADANWWEVFEAIVELGDPGGRRVLEIGCGTGRLAEALTERTRARIFALDASAAMVERARARGVNARQGRAELLPFKADWFDTVVMRMVLHLLDRKRALVEARRVLAAEGRIVIASEDPASFDRVWFARFFPSLAAIDRLRFPSAEALEAELADAGFEHIRLRPLHQQRTIARETALDLLRSKAYSTFELLDPDEFESGVTRAEAELPPSVNSGFDWLLAVAAA